MADVRFPVSVPGDSGESASLAAWEANTKLVDDNPVVRAQLRVIAGRGGPNAARAQRLLNRRS